MIQRVCIVGLGYVGLSTATILAQHGVDVHGCDIDAQRVAAVNAGTSPIDEPDLHRWVSNGAAAARLKASAAPAAADVFVIAVPTPLKANFTPDTGYVYAAVQSLAPFLEAGNLVILESTSPVGTTELVCEWLAELRADLSLPHRAGEASDIRVAYCPERVLPGCILDELVHNDRVIGGITPACAAEAATLYRIFARGTCHLTTARTAELVKLAENAYRDVNIAFANEMSLVCHGLSIDPWEVIELANRHPRVDILQPGPGVGGHCIPIDAWFIADSEPTLTPLIRTSRQVNDSKPTWVAAQVAAACAGIADPVIACLGLAYKANVSDLRESPALAVVKQVQATLQGRLLVVEPHISALPADLAGNPRTEMVELDTALDAADVVVLLTDHREFEHVERDRLSGKPVVDPRGFWRTQQVGTPNSAGPSDQ